MGRRTSDTSFKCSACGATAPKWLGRCPSCEAWGTFAAEPALETRSRVVPQPMTAIEADAHVRASSGMPALDQVLGGGWVQGASVLLAGEPGIGKSTLLLQAS